DTLGHRYRVPRSEFQNRCRRLESLPASPPFRRNHASSFFVSLGFSSDSFGPSKAHRFVSPPTTATSQISIHRLLCFLVRLNPSDLLFCHRVLYHPRQYHRSFRFTRRHCNPCYHPSHHSLLTSGCKVQVCSISTNSNRRPRDSSKVNTTSASSAPYQTHTNCFWTRSLLSAASTLLHCSTSSTARTTILSGMFVASHNLFTTVRYLPEFSSSPSRRRYPYFLVIFKSRDLIRKTNTLSPMGLAHFMAVESLSRPFIRVHIAQVQNWFLTGLHGFLLYYSASGPSSLFFNVKSSHVGLGSWRCDRPWC
ncbi:unnamed protein product, partial [Brassica oleracea]